ncbi:MAG: glycosyltransferase [Candidatus Marsarchaeota archaeon]|jgi:Glycosyltransferase|nr:glycosyltransferase [Candidatus Marsarchaeota archaeon]
MSESLKIAFYTDTFLPAVDGVVTSILTFKEELEKRGHTVHLFASGNSATKNLSHKYKNVHVVRGIRFKKYPQYNLALFPYLTSMRDSRHMDIIHAHTPFMMGSAALLAAKVNKTPIVGSFHTLFTNSSVIKEYTSSNRLAQRLAKKYAWSYARWFYNNMDGVIAPSNAVAALLERKGMANVHTIPNSIDLKRFDSSTGPGKLRKELAGGHGNVVLYVGRISREKKLEVAIKAAQKLKKRNGPAFVFIGTGPALDYYKGMASRLRLDDTVKFLGFVDNKMLPKYYAAGDLLCMPSTFETQGIVALEAMAMGKPVVGADYLALKELISNGRNGEKFRPGDWNGCARKIEKVINNIDSYNEMIKTAKQFSTGKVTTDLLDFYRGVMANSS